MQAAAHPGEHTIPPVRPVNVLMFGDSIDYRIARHLCNISKHEELLEKFTEDHIGQEHNMTGLPPVLLCTQSWPCCTTGLQDSHSRICFGKVSVLYGGSQAIVHASPESLRAANAGVQGSADRQS